MKKLILALVALAFAFAISSCCDQSYCPQNRRCGNEDKSNFLPKGGQQETPYRWDQQRNQSSENQQVQERQHRRW